MARSAGPTLIGALVILVTMPIALFVFLHMWRNRMERELPPTRLARTEIPAVLDEPKEPEAAPPRPAPKVPLRPVDELLIAVFEGRGVSPGQNLMPDGPRVDLSEERNGSLARVDLDRDGSWDEVWSIRLDEIVRYVSPQDDGELTDRYSWMNGEWVPLSTGPPIPAGAP